MNARLTAEERKAHMSALARRWYLAHREETKARSRAWKQTYPEQAKASARVSSRAWRLANLEKVRAGDRARDRAQYWANPEKAREDARIERRARVRTVNGKLSEKLHNIKRRQATKNSPTVTNEELATILARQKGWCYYRERGKHKMAKPTVDHVIPLKQRGSNTAENLVFACLSCNASKGARIWRLC